MALTDYEKYNLIHVTQKLAYMDYFQKLVKKTTAARNKSAGRAREEFSSEHVEDLREDVGEICKENNSKNEKQLGKLKKETDHYLDNFHALRTGLEEDKKGLKNLSQDEVIRIAGLSSNDDKQELTEFTQRVIKIFTDKLKPLLDGDPGSWTNEQVHNANKLDATIKEAFEEATQQADFSKNLLWPTLQELDKEAMVLLEKKDKLDKNDPKQNAKKEIIEQVIKQYSKVVNDAGKVDLPDTNENRQKVREQLKNIYKEHKTKLAKHRNKLGAGFRAGLLAVFTLGLALLSKSGRNYLFKPESFRKLKKLHSQAKEHLKDKKEDKDDSSDLNLH